MDESYEIRRLQQQAEQVAAVAEFLQTSLIVAHARTMNDIVEPQKRFGTLLPFRFASEAVGASTTPANGKPMTNESSDFQPKIYELFGENLDIADELGLPVHFFWKDKNWTFRRSFTNSVYPSEHERGG